jgi:lysophospholipase L1-like esterase
MGWFGDWGMAATERDSDYVHILTRELRAVAPGVVVQFQNIADFERGYWNYDLSKLDSLKQLKPELIILRLGENVDAKTIKEHEFEKYYAGLVSYLTSGNTKARVIHGSSFWKKTTIAQVIQHVSQNRGDTMVDLSKLADIPANMALDKFKNKGVAMHPSDKGMRAIADTLWKKIERP